MTPHYTIQEFLDLSEVLFTEQLSKHHYSVMNMGTDQNQLMAWHNCFSSLKKFLPDLLAGEEDAKEWAIIFEYELPIERGRRPDVVIFG